VVQAVGEINIKKKLFTITICNKKPAEFPRRVAGTIRDSYPSAPFDRMKKRTITADNANHINNVAGQVMFRPRNSLEKPHVSINPARVVIAVRNKKKPVRVLKQNSNSRTERKANTPRLASDDQKLLCG
jgi:hypothetical protein